MEIYLSKEAIGHQELRIPSEFEDLSLFQKDIYITKKRGRRKPGLENSIKKCKI